METKEVNQPKKRCDFAKADWSKWKIILGQKVEDWIEDIKSS